MIIIVNNKLRCMRGSEEYTVEYTVTIRVCVRFYATVEDTLSANPVIF